MSGSLKFENKILDFMCIGGIRSFGFAIGFAFFFTWISIYFVVSCFFELFISNSIHPLMVFLDRISIFKFYYQFFYYPIAVFYSYLFGKEVGEVLIDFSPLFFVLIFFEYLIYVSFWFGLNLGNLVGWIVLKVRKSSE